MFVLKCFMNFVLLLGGILSVENAAAPVIRRNVYPVSALEGRPLIIKTYPGIENYQSDIYEVYAEPYNYVRYTNVFSVEVLVNCWCGL